MKMWERVILGLLSLLVLGLAGYYVYLFMLFLIFSGIWTGFDMVDQEPAMLNVAALPLLLVFLLAFISAKIIYIRLVLRNESLSDRHRQFWLLGMVILSILANPLYWIQSVWKMGR